MKTKTMEEGQEQEPPISKLFTIRRPMNKIKKENKDAPVAQKPSDCNGDRVTVSEFDYCVDNYFRAIETIFKLCGEDDEDYYALQQTEIQHLSCSLTFLSKDFVLYVRGHVWTLDWCPRIHEMPDYHIKCEEPAASENVSPNGSLGISSGRFLISKDVALPRVLLCLAHNGKVAWDVKWRPSNASESKCELRVGYLAGELISGSVGGSSSLYNESYLFFCASGGY